MNTLKKFNAPGYGRIDVMFKLSYIVALIMAVAVVFGQTNTWISYEDEYTTTSRSCISEVSKKSIVVGYTDNSPEIKSVEDQIFFYKAEILKLEARKLSLTVTNKEPITEIVDDVKQVCRDTSRCKPGYKMIGDKCGKLPEITPKTGAGPEPTKTDKPKVSPIKKIIW